MAGVDTSDATPARLLPLQGGHNFRDLGGYATADGRRVRWRHLFRSGTLAHLTQSDRDALAALGVRAICDLRASSEREAEPSAWAPADGRVLSWDYAADSGAVMDAFRAGVPSAERVRAAVAQFYLDAPEDFAERFAALFHLMSTERVPLVIHCSAGKDRTGVTAAIVLRALGVPAATVIEDYVLTDRMIDLESLYGSGRFGGGGTWGFVSRLPTELRAPLIASEPAYIEGMLQRLDERYGSVENYLARRLGLAHGALRPLREAYLDP
jgi:protein-tyrosine phosphatase